MAYIILIKFYDECNIEESREFLMSANLCIRRFGKKESYNADMIIRAHLDGDKLIGGEIHLLDK